MFLPLLYRLRAERVPVGTTEALALGRALAAGAHQNSVAGFYHVARAILVHHEGHLDAFDRAFAAEYRGVLSMSDEMREWLDEVAERGERADGDRPTMGCPTSTSCSPSTSGACASRPSATTAGRTGSGPAGPRRSARAGAPPAG